MFLRNLQQCKESTEEQNAAPCWELAKFTAVTALSANGRRLNSKNLKIIFSSCFRLFVLVFFLFPLTVVILQILNRRLLSLFRGTETGSKVNDDIIKLKEQKFSKKPQLFYNFESCCFLFVFSFSFPPCLSTVLGLFTQIKKPELVSFFCVYFKTLILVRDPC